MLGGIVSMEAIKYGIPNFAKLDKDMLAMAINAMLYGNNDNLDKLFESAAECEKQLLAAKNNVEA